LLLYSDLQQTIAGEGEGNSLAVNRRVVGSSPTSGAKESSTYSSLSKVEPHTTPHNPTLSAKNLSSFPTASSSMPAQKESKMPISGKSPLSNGVVSFLATRSSNGRTSRTARSRNMNSRSQAKSRLEWRRSGTSGSTRRQISGNGLSRSSQVNPMN
jgi:hypothetical protein